MDNQPEFLSERIGSFLRLTINRPRSANAINEVVADGIVTGLGQASRNDDIRAVILTGAGDRIFSAGRDLKNRKTSISRRSIGKGAQNCAHIPRP